MKLRERELDQLAVDLQRFYHEQQRWPATEAEFGTFVTGQQPPKPEAGSESSAAITSSDQRAFRRRYGLDGPPPPFNPLGIILEVNFPEQACLAFKGETGLARVVNKPSN